MFLEQHYTAVGLVNRSYSDQEQSRLLASLQSKLDVLDSLTREAGADPRFDDAIDAMRISIEYTRAQCLELGLIGA